MTSQPITADFATALALACGRIQRQAKRLAGIPAASSTWRVLHTIEMEGPLSPGRLTRLEGNKPSTTTDLIARLERDGLVSRRPDPEDARSRLISVTPSGAEYCRRAEQAIGDGLAPVLADLGERDATVLVECLPVLQTAVAVLRDTRVKEASR